MHKGKNNFRDASVLERVQYHCWVLYNHNAKWNNVKMDRKKTYNGFLTKPDKGLQSLKNLVAERSSIIEQAQIYQTQIDKMILEWDSISKTWK